MSIRLMTAESLAARDGQRGVFRTADGLAVVGDPSDALRSGPGAIREIDSLLEQQRLLLIGRVRAKLFHSFPDDALTQSAEIQTPASPQIFDPAGVVALFTTHGDDYQRLSRGERLIGAVVAAVPNDQIHSRQQVDLRHTGEKQNVLR